MQQVNIFHILGRSIIAILKLGTNNERFDRTEVKATRS